jgi:hypothetical protein
MTLEDLLTKNRAPILDKWFQIVLKAYPADTRGFLKKQRNRFANPVGRTISEGMEALFEELLHGADPAKISNFLDNIMKIRAVQDLSPSKAVGFIPHLKNVVREVLGDQIGQRRMFESLLEFESRVDDMTLLAFESYMKCREKLYEIKANELRRRTAGLLKKTNLFDDMAASTWGSEDTDLKNSS